LVMASRCRFSRSTVWEKDDDESVIRRSVRWYCARASVSISIDKLSAQKREGNTILYYLLSEWLLGIFVGCVLEKFSGLLRCLLRVTCIVSFLAFSHCGGGLGSAFFAYGNI
jgi:hypothetical protein